MTNIKIKVKSFRKMEPPVNGEKESQLTRYVMYADVQTLVEELSEWFDTNPRFQNVDQNVSKGIKESLKTKSKKFHDLNKGILFSADEVKFDNSKNEVEFELSNPNIHGNIDGGHTLRIILDSIQNKEVNEGTYVFIEIIKGIKDREQIVELAKARNKTVQVNEQSIAELESKFQVIKNLLDKKNVAFKDRIIYKMNENKMDPAKNIDVREIIAILNMFNLDIHKNILESNAPIQSYTGKEMSLKKYLALNTYIDESIMKMEDIIEDIFKLYDFIELDFPVAYNKNSKKYGSKKYSSSRPDQRTKFYQRKLREINNSNVPSGLIYPILGAFRSLVWYNENTGKYEWILNPFDLYDKERITLVGFIANDKNIDHPELIGKSKNIWDMLFQRIYINVITFEKNNPSTSSIVALN